MRRRPVLLVIVVGAMSLLPVVSAEASPPVAGCPTSAWVLRDAPAIGTATGSFDQNHDGLACWLEAPRDSGLFTVIDNVVPAR